MPDHRAILEATPRAQRARAKAGIVAVAIRSLPLTFTHDGVTVRLASPPYVTPEGLLRVDVEEPRTNGDGIYLFANPPLRTRTVDDVVTAFMTMVVDAVGR